MTLPLSASLCYFSVSTLLPPSITSSSSLSDAATPSSSSSIYVFVVDTTKRQLRYYKKSKTNAVITATKIIRIARHSSADVSKADTSIAPNADADRRGAKSFALFVVGARLGETERIDHQFDSRRDAAECADAIEALIGSGFQADISATSFSMLRQSRAFKKGAHIYSARTVQLINKKLLVIKDDKFNATVIDITPSHVIRIAADVTVTRKSDRKLRIATSARDFTFRFNKSSERDEWFTHILQQRDVDDVPAMRKSPFALAAKDSSPFISSAPIPNTVPPISRRTSIALFNRSFIPYPTQQPIFISQQQTSTLLPPPMPTALADKALTDTPFVTKRVARPRRMTLPVPQRLSDAPNSHSVAKLTLAPPRNDYATAEPSSPSSNSPIPPPPLSPPPPPPPLIPRIPSLNAQATSSSSSPLSLLLTERERDTLRGFIMSSNPAPNEAARRWSTTALSSSYAAPTIPPTGSSTPPMYRLTVLTDTHESIGFVVLPPSSATGLSLAALRQFIVDQFDPANMTDAFLFLSDGVPVGRKQESVLDAAVVIRNSAVTVRRQRTSIVNANRLYRVFVNAVAIGVVDVEVNESNDITLAELRRRILEQLADALPASFLFQIADGGTARTNQETRLRVSQIHNEQLHIHLTANVQQ